MIAVFYAGLAIGFIAGALVVFAIVTPPRRARTPLVIRDLPSLIPTAHRKARARSEHDREDRW